MVRLYDRLMVERWVVDSYGYPESLLADPRLASLRKDLNPATVVLIDNVAQYYFAHHTTPKGVMDPPETFPQLSPPFPCAFYEYNVDLAMWNVVFTGGPARCVRAGILLHAVNPALVRIRGIEESSHLVLAGVLFIQLRRPNSGDTYGPAMAMFLGIDRDGQATSPLMTQPWGFRDTWMEVVPEHDVRAICRLAGFALPVFLAQSFLHCRNVSTQQHVPPPKLSKAFNRRHGRPLVQFKTLAIEPMKEVLRKQGRIEQNGLPKALHLCRGHFKDYRNSAGLFGKHKGLFWWDMHARGDLEHGAVVKDYAIKLAK